jgi:putative tryptophan/tyrosine transport system substrate-binding protein
MRRRQFITFLGGAVTWPVMASAQQPMRMPRVIAISPVQFPAFEEATRSSLRDLGYVEGRNIRLEFRNAAVDGLPALAQELVREGGADVILAQSTPAALAAYKATQTIPIVVFAAVDPVGSGLADSLAHPGRNVTGVTVFSEETSVKRVELMREVLPHAVRLGVVTTKVASSVGSLRPVLETGRKVGFAVEPINVDDPSDLRKTLSAEVLANFDALVFVPDVILDAHMAEIIKLIDASNKPAIFNSPEWVTNGGFISLGPDYPDANRHLVSQLDRVLKGAKPADLPFERPTKFYLRINMRIAKTLGIELPPVVLARADEVIE